MAAPLRSARREAQRYRYSKASRSGFIELATDNFSADDLRTRLLQVPDVLQVIGHRLSKAEQNNASLGHAQQRNWKVRTQTLINASANDFEFEITTNSNLSDIYLQQHGIPRTVTVMFKDVPAGMLMEGWRVLMLAVSDLALFPAKVAAWHAEVTWSGLPAQTLTTFSKFMHNGRIWFSNDHDPTMFFFGDEAASSGWTMYVDIVRCGPRYWWHNEHLCLYFFDTI